VRKGDIKGVESCRYTSPLYYFLLQMQCCPVTLQSTRLSFFHVVEKEAVSKLSIIKDSMNILF